MYILIIAILLLIIFDLCFELSIKNNQIKTLDYKIDVAKDELVELKSKYKEILKNSKGNQNFIKLVNDDVESIIKALYIEYSIRLELCFMKVGKCETIEEEEKNSLEIANLNESLNELIDFRDNIRLQVKKIKQLEDDDS